MHVQSYCFANKTYCFFVVLVAVAVVLSQTVPKIPKERVFKSNLYFLIG